MLSETKEIWMQQIGFTMMEKRKITGNTLHNTERRIKPAETVSSRTI
jgi:hypothetical protein